MATEKNWLTLTEYSGHYEVSISTLRRRIRSGRVEHRYSNGKYLLRNLPLSEHTPSQSTANHLSTQAQNIQVSAPPQKERSEIEPEAKVDAKEANDQEGPVLSTAHRLLSELKKAYSLILQEKEEQVLILKDEVADLQTLVRVLEGENKRLSNQAVARVAATHKKKEPLRAPIHWEETELELDL